MVEDVIASLQNSRRAFEQNVRDEFGRSIDGDIYEPLDAELRALQDATDAAHAEQQAIRNLLGTLRMII